MKSFFLVLLSVFLFLSPLKGFARDATPVDLLQQGLEAMFDERYDDAIKAFDAALEYDKNNEAAQRGLKGAQRKRQEAIDRRRAGEKPALDAARKAMGNGDWPEAVDCLNGILNRQSDHPEALALLDKIRVRMMKQMDKAKPQSSDWYYAQGVLAYIDRDWLKAVDSWDQVAAFNPDQVGLLSKISQAKERLKVQEKENRILLLQSVAFDNLKKGNYAEAIKNWQQLLALDPGNDQAKEGVAQAQKALDEQRRRNQKEEVQNLTEKAMDAYIDRDHKTSLQLWNKVLELDPENTLARDYIRRIRGSGAEASGGAPAQSGYDKAMGFLAENRLPEAIECLERYASKYPNDQKAAAALKDSKAKQKELSDKAYQVGLMTYSQGDIQGAIAQWQAALRADPDYQRARQAIIKAMAEQKKRQK